MEFHSIKNQDLNIGLFEKAVNDEDPVTVMKTETENKDIEKGYYTESSLRDLKEHCEGILLLGDQATAEEVQSLKKALDEVSQLEKGDIVVEGETVTVYFKK